MSTLHTGEPHVSHRGRINKDDEYRNCEAAIKVKLTRIALLVSRRRYDAAGLVAEIVAQDRAKLAQLRLEHAEETTGPLHPQPRPGEPSKRYTIKRKIYKTWSDK